LASGPPEVARRQRDDRARGQHSLSGKPPGSPHRRAPAAAAGESWLGVDGRRLGRVEHAPSTRRETPSTTVPRPAASGQRRRARAQPGAEMLGDHAGDRGHDRRAAEEATRAARHHPGAEARVAGGLPGAVPTEICGRWRAGGCLGEVYEYAALQRTQMWEPGRLRPTACSYKALPRNVSKRGHGGSHLARCVVLSLATVEAGWTVT
jgi:hypothetical protein